MQHLIHHERSISLENSGPGSSVRRGLETWLELAGQLTGLSMPPEVCPPPGCYKRANEVQRTNERLYRLVYLEKFRKFNEIQALDCTNGQSSTFPTVVCLIFKLVVCFPWVFLYVFRRCYIHSLLIFFFAEATVAACRSHAEPLVG